MNLPEGWSSVTLDALLVQIVGGGTPSKANPAFFRGTVPFMTVKDMKYRFPTDTIDHISNDAIQSSATSVVPADTLIVATRISLGKVARPRFETAINQDLKALFLAEGINKTFVEHWWRWRSGHIQSLGTGTTVKGIRLEDIRSLEINVPPTGEQRRIAAKLDAVLARVDACREHLDRVPAIFKRFRQAVLAAATSGQLTEEWRNKQGQYPWVPKTLGACGIVSGGLTKNAKRQSYGLQKRYLRVANVYADHLDLSDVAEIGLTEAEYAKTKLRPDDLLIVEGNGSLDQIGRVAL